MNYPPSPGLGHPDDAPGTGVEWRELDARASLPHPGETAEQAAARRAVDRRLVAILLAGDLSPEDEKACFRSLAKRLMVYAHRILMPWTATGRIFTECGTSRTPFVSKEVPDWSEDEREHLVVDVIVRAVRKCRANRFERLRQWDPDAGKSLCSYFLTCCTQLFPRYFNRWLKEHQVSRSVLQHSIDDDELGLDQLAGSEPDPAVVAVRNDAVSRAIKPMTDDALRQVVGYEAIGYTRAEACRRAGITESAATYRLDKHRRRLGDDDGVNPPEC